MGIILGEFAAARTGMRKIQKRSGLWVSAQQDRQSFYVLADPSETRDDILQTVGVPQVGTLYLGSVCRGHDVRELESVFNPFTQGPGVLCEVIAEFDNDVDPDEAQNQETTAPENRRAVVNWHGEFEEEALEKDVVTGKPIAVSNGERALLVAPVPICVLEVSRYETWPFNPLTMLLYSGRLNSQDFYDAPEGTAFLEPIEAPEETLEGTRYVHATYRVKFKMKFDPENPGEFLKDTWKARILNQGNVYIDESTSPRTIRRSVDKEGNPIKVNLDEDGHRLGVDDDPTYSEFNRLTKTDLNELNLGPFA